MGHNNNDKTPKGWTSVPFEQFCESVGSGSSFVQQYLFKKSTKSKFLHREFFGI